ncbi:hypothetical protein F511_27423 [Dorcoceras hygrometricum]|uniref:P-loop containing nucleoside triphosphate hydrolases superfamily protein n=1 Tax=Dorcoceras hygrometricum TaxID=472368 RepID=A0A2Z7APP5_9LAMI|nr:hypothetical protein F511_27423 [Dorcoceras hygrometricum]
MKNSHFFSSDEEQSLGPNPSFCWWRTAEDFDENGRFKVEISDPSMLTPRLKVLREMERLAFVSGEGLDDFRHKLMTYRAGDFWVPVGGINKEEVDVPKVVTVLLSGLAGSGKSSFVNLMYSVLGRSGLIPFAQTSGDSSNYTTMYLEEHNILRSPRNGFCFFDTRGLDQDRMEEGLKEFSGWMADGVRHNQPCFRQEDEKVKGHGGSMGIASSRYVKRKVNCVMVVADLSLIRKAFESGDLKPIEALRDLFHLPSAKSANENPILILTHGDTLNAEDRINGRLKICEYLGIPETTGAYDIPCLTEQGILAEESDPVTAFALSEAVYRALLQSDRTHLPKKKFLDYMILIFSWIMWCIASFFALLAHLFSKFGHHQNKLKL